MSIRYRFLRFPGGKGKAVTLSYDDGIIHDLKFAEKISQYGFKCTFNLNSKNFNDALSDEQINENFIQKGHEIAVHGALHRATGMHRPIEIIRDILQCRIELEERFDSIIRGMAYPGTGITLLRGDNTYENIKENLKNLDIVYARTLGGDNDSFDLPSDWYAWMPTAHHTNPKIFSYIDKFINHNVFDRRIFEREPKLFYMWGHSYEFERANNWGLLDEICSRIGGHDDIWYATNIEIYNYVEAYNALVYSADATRVYNPSILTIWFEIKGKIYEIKPGETLKINL